MSEVKADAPLLKPIITTKGMEKALGATLGNPCEITHIGIGDSAGTANESMEALPGLRFKLKVADGRVVGDTQVNISALIEDTQPSINIYGIGFYLADGTLFAIYRSTSLLLSHSAGSTLLVGMDLVMSNIPANSITVQSTGSNLTLGDYVPLDRTINGLSLKTNIRLEASHVKALPLPDVAEEVNLNSLTVSGVYSFTGSAANRPFGSSPGNVLVMNYGGSYCTQLATSAADNTMKVRTKTGASSSSWTAWETVAFGSNFASANHDHDSTYSKTGHDHAGKYSEVGHTHNYAGPDHTHNELYAPIGRKINGKYDLRSDFSLSASDVGAMSASTSTVTDAVNNMNKPGIYSMSAACLGWPHNYGGSLLVMVAQAYIWQMAVNGWNGAIKVRNYNGSNWSAWTDFFGSGDTANTPLDSLGSIAFLYINGNAEKLAGDTAAGSGMSYSNCDGSTSNAYGPKPTGTWRCLGCVLGGTVSQPGKTTLWQKVA